MKRPFVKVCGITREEDALSAALAGVHAIGFILIPGSPRYVETERARAIASKLPASVARVGVVADQDAVEIRAQVAEIGLSAIQAHGNETMDECRGYGIPTVKALPSHPDASLETLEPFREIPILLDGWSSEALGGTGRIANWDLALRARDSGYRVLLAGGLGPGNILEAVRTVEPIGVDLNSGVETGPGIKSARLLQECLQGLKGLEPMEESVWPW